MRKLATFERFTGLMGLIWRTRILGPNIAALARAGWEQPWNDHPTQPERQCRLLVQPGPR